MLLSYFTCESTNRKVDWLRDLNWSHHGSLKSGLMCSFNDKELSEFIPAKKRCGGPLPTKQAVTHVGRQEDGSWVLNENIIISASGAIVKEDTLILGLATLPHVLALLNPLMQLTFHLPWTTRQ